MCYCTLQYFGQNILLVHRTCVIHFLVCGTQNNNNAMRLRSDIERMKEDDTSRLTHFFLLSLLTPHSFSLHHHILMQEIPHQTKNMGQDLSYILGIAYLQYINLALCNLIKVNFLGIYCFTMLFGWATAQKCV